MSVNQTLNMKFLIFKQFRLLLENNFMHTRFPRAYASYVSNPKVKSEGITCALMSHPAENMFCHSVLEKNNNYNVFNIPKLQADLTKDTINDEIMNILEKNEWSKYSSRELCQIFREASLHSNNVSFMFLSDDKFSGLCNALIENIRTLSDEELQSVLLNLSLWPLSNTSREPNFYPLWKALDDVCSARKVEWKINKLLLFIDAWFINRLVRLSDFSFYSIFYLCKKHNRLTPHQLIQVFFYLNAMRIKHKGINMYNLEFCLEKCVQRLSIEEIGVAMLGFFKTQTPVRSGDLLKYIINKTILEMDKIPEVTLSSLMKSFRLSMLIPIWNELPRLLEAVVPQLPRLSLQSAIHVGLLTGPSQILHTPSFDIISQKLINSIQSARMKDMEKVLFPLSQTNYKPQTDGCIFTSIIEELRKPSREEEIKRYPRCFVALVYYLCLCSHFPEDLISTALRRDFIKHAYGDNKFVYGRELPCIDFMVSQNNKNYSGERLDPFLKSYLWKRYSTFVPNTRKKLSKHSKFIHTIMTLLQEMYGEDKVKYVYIVPGHPRADIIYQVDKKGRSMELPPEIKNLQDFESEVKAPSSGGTWQAVIACSKNMFCLGTNRLTGFSTLKIDAITNLGYKPHLVSILEWPEEETDRSVLLKHLKNILDKDS